MMRLFIHVVNVTYDQNRDWTEMLPWPFKSWIEGKCCHPDSNHKTCRLPFSDIHFLWVIRTFNSLSACFLPLSAIIFWSSIIKQGPSVPFPRSFLTSLVKPPRRRFRTGLQLGTPIRVSIDSCRIGDHFDSFLHLLNFFLDCPSFLPPHPSTWPDLPNIEVSSVSVRPICMSLARSSELLQTYSRRLSRYRYAICRENNWMVRTANLVECQCLERVQWSNADEEVLLASFAMTD
jgi:hypothetical protein